MTKTIYDAPLVRILEVRIGGMFLASGEQMTTVIGSWDEEED